MNVRITREDLIKYIYTTDTLKVTDSLRKAQEARPREYGHVM